MIEHGALSITGIQDLAASRIQATVRGYLYRKTYLQRELLFMEHERRLKNPIKYVSINDMGCSFIISSHLSKVIKMMTFDKYLIVTNVT